MPVEYLTLLGYSNGGEGSMASEPGWFQLWSAEEVVSLNKAHEIEDFLPGFFGFGSSGGGESLAFDTRLGQPLKIVMVPWILMAIEEVMVIANNMAEFIQAMGREK